MVEPIELEVRLKNMDASLMSFSQRLQKNIDDVVRRMRLDRFTPVSTGVTSTGATSTAGIVKPISMGVVAGLAAGGVIAAVAAIAKALSDMPIIVGIMKLLKVILLLLLMPLIPILKPTLIALAKLAGVLSKITIPSTKAENISAQVGGVLGGVVGGMVGGPIGVAIGVMIGALIGQLLPKALQGLKNLWTIQIAWLEVGVDWVKGILKNALSGLKNLWIIQVSWIEKIVSSVAGFMKDFGGWLWERIQSLFVGAIDVVKMVWPFIQGLFDGFVNVGTTLWEWFTGLFKGTIDVGTVVWEWFKSLFVKESIKKSSGASGSWVSQIINPLGTGNRRIADAVLQGGNIITTDPKDYIIATKNPASLSGGNIININIDKPTLMSQSDINNLVRQIEQKLYLMQRRYNSYV